MIPLAFTLAIAHDFSSETMGGFSERYCFPNPDRAIEELVKWHKRQFDDQGPTGWVATRMVSKKAIKESFDKHYGEEYGHHILPFAFNGELYTSDTLSKNKKKATQELGMDIEEYESLSAFLKYSG